jgi:hypothetical protein
MPDCLASYLEFQDNHLVFAPLDVGMKLARRHLPVRPLCHCDSVPASCFANHATSNCPRDAFAEFTEMESRSRRL